jgi:hypothetical protein
MIEPKVGHYYVDKTDDDNYYGVFKILEESEDSWGKNWRAINQKSGYEFSFWIKSPIYQNLKEMKHYNSPLYKTLNS